MYGIETNKIYNIDCLEGLKMLPDDSIDCVITSPPYWALRDYKTEPITWDADPECEHVWGEEKKNPVNLQAGSPEFKRQWREGATSENATQGQFCLKCSAWKGSLGLEPTFELYIKHLCDVFDEVKRALKKTGTCFVVLGDTYYTKSGDGFRGDRITGNKAADAGLTRANELRGMGLLPSKCLCQIPSRFAIEMTNRGWILRNELIWHKPNCLPSSTRDRFTCDYDKIFFFVKSKRYYFDQQLEPFDRDTFKRSKHTHRSLKHTGVHAGITNKRIDKWSRKVLNNELAGRNMRCVWKIPTQPFGEKHFAVYPEKLVQIPLRAGCPKYVCRKCGKPRGIGAS